MDKQKAVQKMTEVMAKFVGYTGKVLPDDMTAKLHELAERETQPLAKEIYKTMFENHRLSFAKFYFQIFHKSSPGRSPQRSRAGR